MDWDGETVEYYDIQKNMPTFLLLINKGIVRTFIRKERQKILAKAYNAVPNQYFNN
ncbi:MAG: hypothetical protein IPK11_15665 [Ignavibacteria bacterium]|nr:hypothetical protein [Ignavibacteria bacterium]